MKEGMRVCDLAGELHVSSRELIRGANELGINVIRAVARLTSGQEHLLREAVTTGRIKRKRQAATVPPSRRPPPREDPEALRQGYCQCCELPFLYRPLEQSNVICKDCEPHYEEGGEPVTRKVARHHAHAVKLRRLMDSYRQDSYEQRALVDEVYAKRDRWMKALVEVMLAHAPDNKHGGCVCGAADYPCVTRRQLGTVNRGIARRVDELEAMSEHEFKRVLYGDDYSYFTDWDDGVA